MNTTTKKTLITVKTSVNAPVEKVWKYWTDPKHIVHWNFASDDWHTPRAENELRVGSKFMSRMEAKDGSSGFDFIGEYTKLIQHKLIEYKIADGRAVQVLFYGDGDKTTITENFESEQTNPVDIQRQGWQAILNNFKKYVESRNKLKVLHFDIIINAKAEKVYNTMFNESSWREWTSAFNPDSRFIGKWDKGSRIQFVGTDQNGKVGGMSSIIKENIPYRFVSIEHLNMIEDGKEVTGVDNSWSGAMENYTFSEINGATTLFVELDSSEEFMDYFNTTWPKALNILKSICER